MALLALVCSAACLLPGCATGRAGSRSASIDELHLLSLPVALDLDQALGPDGFGIKIYGVSRAHPKPVPIKAGSVEVLMFDGMQKEENLATATPRRTWKFTPADLEASAFTTSIGTGYQFALPWGDARPLGGRITVLARYLPADGPVVYSKPSSISLVSK